MTDPVTMPPTIADYRTRRAQDLHVYQYSMTCFGTHPEVDSITFAVDFPNRQESVTVRRDETLPPRVRDFEGWREEVEATWTTTP